MRPACNILCALAFGMTAALATSVNPQNASAQTGINETAFNRCRTIADEATRLRCYERSVAEPRGGTSHAQGLGKWRLVRTPNPQGGKDAISIMRGAELSGSDPDFAGLMLRCSETDIDVLVVLITPLPPRAHPQILVEGTPFNGTVSPPGAAIMLPAEAADLANGGWQALSQLKVEVRDDDRKIRGLVDIDGLKAAMQALTATCALR